MQSPQPQLRLNVASSQRLVRHEYSRTPLETMQPSGEESAALHKATKTIQTAPVVVVVSPDGLLVRLVVEVASASLQQAVWDTPVSLNILTHTMQSCDEASDPQTTHVTFIHAAAPAAVLLTGAPAITTVGEAASE